MLLNFRMNKKFHFRFVCGTHFYSKEEIDQMDYKRGISGKKTGYSAVDIFISCFDFGIQGNFSVNIGSDKILRSN